MEDIAGDISTIKREKWGVQKTQQFGLLFSVLVHA